MFATLIFTVLIAAGASASSSASAYDRASMPVVPPISGMKSADAFNAPERSRILAGLIQNILTDLLHYFEPLILDELHFDYYFCDCVGFSVSVRKAKIHGIGGLKLNHLDYENNRLLVDVTFNKLTLNLDGASINVYVAGFPITITASGTVELINVRLCSTIGLVNLRVVSFEADLSLEHCNSNLVAFIAYIEVCISDAVNAIFIMFPKIVNGSSIIRDFINNILSNVLVLIFEFLL